MIYLLASVVCSVLVSVLLKLARRWRIDVGQAVAWNYLVAGALTAWLLQPSSADLHAAGAAWPALLALGVLLPAIFVALGSSVREAGIVRTDTAQRLSLLLSLLAAFALFGEPLTPGKVLGATLGVLALLAMLWRAGGLQMAAQRARWRYPWLVFAGFGCIDILFKRVAAAGVPLGASLQLMFALALLLALGWQMARRWRDGTRFTVRSLAGGLLLGLFNFGNILFYLRAHQALPGHPAGVFAGMNLGVVMLGALVGTLGFGERLGRINLVGLGLALLAIALVARG